MLTELPFSNRTVKVELPGSAILIALENGVSLVESSAGRFPQVSGLAFEYDLSKPAGNRIMWATVGSKPLDPAGTYTLATDDYLFNGGDGYTSLKTGKTLFNLRDAKLLTNDVMAYLKARGEVSPKLEGRITRR